MTENPQRPAALITGASSGIGRAIVNVLLDLGYEVIGIGRHFQDANDPAAFHSIQHVGTPLREGSVPFHPICQDLTRTGELTELIRRLKKEYTFSVLVNNAGVGYFGPHEEQSPAKIHEMTAVNLEVPLLLANLLLRDLKQTSGAVINISSVTALKSSPHGCAYGATKAALTAFTESLFDEVRKYGVRVSVIHPDMTQSNFYRNADFTTDIAEDAYLTAETVADAVRYLLTAPSGCVPTSMTLQPQKHRIRRKSAQPSCASREI
ncbi:MAG: SDR family oxidoreductase [Lachnospiraceae bacterium]|nr:SDR family oxidoreductase [Lachnospiraceae bacterium]